MSCLRGRNLPGSFDLKLLLARIFGRVLMQAGVQRPPGQGFYPGLAGVFLISNGSFLQSSDLDLPKTDTLDNSHLRDNLCLLHVDNQ